MIVVPALAFTQPFADQRAVVDKYPGNQLLILQRDEWRPHRVAVEDRKNKRNSPVYQGKKPELKSTGNICLTDLNRFNTIVYSR